MDERGERAFPRARYVLSRDEWDFWATRPERLRPNPAYGEDFRRIGREVGVRRLAQLRDMLVYNPADIADPDWFSIDDFDPQQAVATRRRVLGQAAEDGGRLMATHAPFPGLGRVERDGPGWRWHPLMPPAPAPADA